MSAHHVTAVQADASRNGGRRNRRNRPVRVLAGRISSFARVVIQIKLHRYAVANPVYAGGRTISKSATWGSQGRRTDALNGECEPVGACIGQLELEVGDKPLDVNKRTEEGAPPLGCPSVREPQTGTANCGTSVESQSRRGETAAIVRRMCKGRKADRNKTSKDSRSFFMTRPALFEHTTP